MKYRESMKYSGVEYLGEIPQHWSILSIRRIAVTVQTGGTPSSNLSRSNIERKILWYTPGDFGSKLTLGDSARKITEDAVSNDNIKIFPAGSVFIVSIGATLGKVGVNKFAASANQQINVIVPREKVNSYFLAYSLSIKVDVMRYLSNSATIGIMNQEKTKEILLAIPPLSEQAKIIYFLELETKKIDTLISKQQKLIALLTEKRQAIISHAVTKGRDADVPVKDSGIAWLGEIPAHWEIKRLKSIFKLITEKTKNHKYRIGLENIESWSGKFINTNSEFEGDGITFKAKDILFGKLRPYLAKVFLATQEGEAVGDFHILRSKNKEIQEEFFVYKLLDFNLIKLINSATFGAKMPRVSWDFMANLSIAFPSSSEQLKIATFLDRETSKIDKLIIEVNRAIELLKERRTALISATVTGKIDVRDITPDLPMEVSPDVQFTPGTTL